MRMNFAASKRAAAGALLITLLLGKPCVAAQGGRAALRTPPRPRQSQATEPAVAPTYSFTVLDFPGTLTTVGFGINSGAATPTIEIVGGIGNDSISPIGYSNGFLMHYTMTKGLTSETYRGVNIPGALEQLASGVNHSGQIVGYYSGTSGAVHGYLYSGGKFTTIDVPFSVAKDTACYGINNSGEIVGLWDDAATTHGFLLSGGQYTTLDDPNAGTASGQGSQAFGVNDFGQIVGPYMDANGVYHGFLATPVTP